MEDGAKLEVLVSDEGVLLVVCPKCKKLWTCQLKRGKFPTPKRDAGVARMLKETMRRTPSLLKGFKVGL
jgi:hypothetical protein